MPLYIKDDATAWRVTEFAQKRGISKQVARRIAGEAGWADCGQGIL